jgi:signal transduction histidine kinase
MDDRKPTCGPFNVKIYSWDASPEDQKAVFGETSILRQMIRPNSGVKLFRDGFRVYPYGNPDNDWLGMDARRIGQSFELRLSRNQVIGALEISSKTNPQLIDKTDREGLIDNQAYEDFVDLVLSAISTCENERFEDRRKLKKTLGRTRPEDYDKLVFTRNLAALSKMVWEQSKLPGEARLALRNLIDQARDSLESILAEKEQPLLIAASFGITYLMPTHEIKRNIDEASKILRRMRETSGADDEKINAVISHLRTADSMIHGLAKLSMKSQEEAFPIKRAAESALALMKDKLDRNSIECKVEGTDKVKAKGKENLITILLLNFLDNSFYWLLRKKPNERQIKIFVGEYVNRPTIIVSDSGPGFEDHDINIVTLPFFTRKPDGMGLGLYIADRIARMNGGNLLLLDPDDFPGLLAGANIAVSLQNVEGKRK